ncbi:MAG TPA: DUF4350 domain-containing protein, partial [Candidatus Polarisedimenticolia bacterium]|nr:DUF4350 domain-containing protein [Candidatus Polarisedimenticolia bacterium]
RLRLAAAAAVACSGALLLGGWWGWQPAGRKAAGRVVIDESRSGWEPAAGSFDHARYGQRSLYNYALWRAWIELHYDVRVSSEPLSAEDLEAADVLIVKTPTRPYDDGAAARIERFVRAGGGLWLIGDHTNLFGMSTVLNRLARPYGLRFELDDTFPLDHEGSDRFRPPRPARHPVLRGISSYAFETSCSLSVPWTAQHVMVGRGLGSEPADYGHVHFFGDIQLQASERFGLFVQAAVVRHGAGRVAAFSDSTNFSNFSLLWPGRREITLNTIDWLNRRPVRAEQALGWALLAAAAAALGAAAWLLAGIGLPRGLGGAAAAWAALGAFTLGAAGAGEWSARRAGEVKPLRAYRTMAFDASVSGFRLQPDSAVLTRERPSWTGFNALFINAARSGLWPEAAPDLTAALKRSDAVALLNPVRPLTPAQSRALGAFLGRGGRLLVADSAHNDVSAAHDLLARFGLAPAADLRPLRSPRGVLVPAVTLAGRPGAERKVTASGAEVLWRDVGRGRVVAVADAALLSDRAAGGVYAPAGSRQRRLLQGHAEILGVLMAPSQEKGR